MEKIFPPASTAKNSSDRGCRFTYRYGSLTISALPKEKSLGDFQEALKAHFDPKLLVITEHFQYCQRS